jgi:hypothetical protein
MAAAVRWASLGPPQCARTASVVSKCNSFHGGSVGRSAFGRVGGYLDKQGVRAERECLMIRGRSLL